jgi:PAS domain S-box-containing protein
MILSYSGAVTTMLLAGIVSALLTSVAWRHRSVPIIQPFFLLMSSVTVWIFGYAGELMSPDLSTVLLLNDIEYPAVTIVPVAWLFLVLVYTGRGHYLTRRTVPFFFVIPAIVWFLVLTNPYHYLFYSGFSPMSFDSTTVWIYEHGPLFWLHIGYSYLLTFAALVIAAGRLFGSSRLYRRQSSILLLAATIPALTNIAYVVPSIPFPAYDLTPISFFLSGIILAIGILRYQLFSSVPVAYSRVFSTMGDGVVVVSPKNRVLDLNPAAEAIAGVISTDAIGQDLGAVIPGLAPVTDDNFLKKTECHIEIRQDIPNPRYFDVLVTPMSAGMISDGAYLCMLRDITDRKVGELALSEANRKISLLANITRHDITNKIVAVHSYLELIRELTTDPRQIQYLDKQEQAVMAINEQIAFTKEYQQLGTEAPSWQDAEKVLRIAKTQVDFGEVSLESTIGSWEILADPMLFKVFYNLCDNAMKYGGPGITRIRISSHRDERDLVIVVEDDGAGISAQDLPRLFERGYGKHTGLGLFLSREILSITDITIQVTSPPGKGAHFEIRVPAGKFRSTGDTG